MKTCWRFTPPQAIQDVDVFFLLHLNRFGEIKHYITCSPMDPLQWMGAVRMRVQTAEKNNPQVIHMTSVHQLTPCEVKSWMFLRNKFIINMSSINNSAFSNKKKKWVVWIRREICSDEVLFTSQQSKMMDLMDLFLTNAVFDWLDYLFYSDGTHSESIGEQVM